MPNANQSHPKRSRSKSQTVKSRGKQTQTKPPRASHRRRKSGKRRRSGRKLRPDVLIIIVVFAIAFGALIQQAAILRLDRQISNLQDQVNTQKSLNDSKEGKIVSSHNLAKIEKKARSYGMSEPKADQYVYMVSKHQKKQKTNFDYLIDWFKAKLSKYGIIKK
jgi:cell division protein FtsL